MGEEEEEKGEGEDRKEDRLVTFVPRCRVDLNLLVELD